MKNVLQTKKTNFCCSCGACQVVCPKNAITYKYDDGLFVPQIDTGRCVDCGICQSVCPSSTPNVDILPAYRRGPVRAAYACYSKDDKLRWNSGSGGFVSQLIIDLLSLGAYKRAYVVHYDKFSGEPARLTAATTKEEVYAAAKSKYIPVSVEAVVEAVRKKEIAGSIVVCTPCELLAIRKAMRLYKVDDSRVLFVGLFCERMFNYKVYDYYEKEYGVYDKLFFKEKEPNGWPGDSSLIKGDQRLKIDRKVRMALKTVYPVGRCDACNDKLNNAADICAGDCYDDACSHMDGGVGGVSSIIVRTKKGTRALSLCRNSFVLRKRSIASIERSQHVYKPTKMYILFTRIYGIARFLPRFAYYCARLMVPVFRLGQNRRSVCIDIANLNNRGDWLMFEAIYEQVRKRMPSANVSVVSSAFASDRAFFLKRGIVEQVDSLSVKDIVRRLCRALCSRDCSWLRCMMSSEVDLLFFAPGFRFADQFSYYATESFVRKEFGHFESFSKKGRKVVFLPQAFGPFKTDLAQRRVVGCCKYADRIYAREKTSYDYLTILLPEAKDISIAPDFTCLYTGEDYALPFKKRDYVVVVPNRQMIVQTGYASNYCDFMISVVRLLKRRGENVVILNHEGTSDNGLIEVLNAAIDNTGHVVKDVSGGVCKSVIRGAKFVITSRFHGLVSSLTEGVPTLCTSWSHKYQEFVTELGSPKSCVDISDVKSAIAVVEDALANPANYSAKESALKEFRQSVCQMWDDVERLINSIGGVQR